MGVVVGRVWVVVVVGILLGRGWMVVLGWMDTVLVMACVDLRGNTIMSKYLYIITVGRSLIAWFNDCDLGKSGQTANPIIVNINPVPYHST